LDRSGARRIYRALAGCLCPIPASHPPFRCWLNPPGLAEAELKKRTLTNLYNARPAWLAAAHRTLDGAVCAAYGWPDDLSDEEILGRLLR